MRRDNDLVFSNSLQSIVGQSYKGMEMKIAEYEILEYYTPEELAASVMLCLQDGWQLWGSPFSFATTENATNYADGPYYNNFKVCQAVVKYE